MKSIFEYIDYRESLHLRTDGTCRQTDTAIVADNAATSMTMRSFTKVIIGHSSGGKLNFPQDGIYSLPAWVYTEAVDSESHVTVSKGDEQYALYNTTNTDMVPLWQFVDFKGQMDWQTFT